MDFIIKKPSQSELIDLCNGVGVVAVKESNLTELTLNLKNNEFILIAKKEKEIIGYIRFKLYKNKGSIESFIVNPSYHGKGVAQQLYSECESFFKRKNIKLLFNYCYLTDERARGFWLKNDFKIIKKLKDDNEKEMYYLKKKLIN